MAMTEHTKSHWALGIGITLAPELAKRLDRYATKTEGRYGRSRVVGKAVREYLDRHDRPDGPDGRRERDWDRA
jgi:metal-responsive CopG/Arc/MetJ family transcriptional regulator